jgi:hypothetical protein
MRSFPVVETKVLSLLHRGTVELVTEGRAVSNTEIKHRLVAPYWNSMIAGKKKTPSLAEESPT